MSGPAESKVPIKAKAYLHKQDAATRSRVMHIDIEGEIAEIIKEGEITFVKGKQGGIFIALKKQMIERAKKMIGNR